MKEILIASLFLLNLNIISSESSDYNYLSYSAKSIDINLTNKNISNYSSSIPSSSSSKLTNRQGISEDMDPLENKKEDVFIDSDFNILENNTASNKIYNNDTDIYETDTNIIEINEINKHTTDTFITETNTTDTITTDSFITETNSTDIITTDTFITDINTIDNNKSNTNLAETNTKDAINKDLITTINDIFISYSNINDSNIINVYITETNIRETNNIDTTNLSNQIINETYTYNQTIITNSIDNYKEASVVLLGYSHFEIDETEKYFSFFIYFVPVLNSIYSKILTFPITVLYNTTLRYLDSSQSICTLEDSSTETKLKYKCKVHANTANIRQIQIEPKFTFSEQYISLAGITSLANSYMNDIQKVNELNYLESSNVCILEHSTYNKYNTNLFNISGIMNGEPTFGDTDLVLNINKDSNVEINVNCSISKIKEKNYTLDCQSEENINSNYLQSAYSKINNDILLINFDPQNEETSTNSTTNSSDSNKKSYNGLSRGGIVVIVLVSLSALIAIIFIIYSCTRKNRILPNNKVKDITNYPFGSTTYINE